MVVNYNNDVVATKAWSHLFAVAEWATNRQRSKIVTLTRDYLHLWMEQNYGGTATLLSHLASESSQGKPAGMVRSEFRDAKLDGFTVEKVHHKAAAAAEVDIRLTMDGEDVGARMRWLRVDEKGTRLRRTRVEPGAL
jgi:hypothetical protein